MSKPEFFGAITGIPNKEALLIVAELLNKPDIYTTAEHMRWNEFPADLILNPTIVFSKSKDDYSVIVDQINFQTWKKGVLRICKSL